jgi:hypothetical protein
LPEASVLPVAIRRSWLQPLPVSRWRTVTRAPERFDPEEFLTFTFSTPIWTWTSFRKSPGLRVTKPLPELWK